MLATPTDVSCAVEVFIATALLHRENPNRPEFTIQEIVRRAAQENITGEMRSGVNVHASQHCVANKAPNPNRHKMLYASGKNTRRLLLPMRIRCIQNVQAKSFQIPEKFPSVTCLYWSGQNSVFTLIHPADRRLRDPFYLYLRHPVGICKPF